MNIQFNLWGSRVNLPVDFNLISSRDETETPQQKTVLEQIRESPDPFKGTEQALLDYLKKYYPEDMKDLKEEDLLTILEPVEVFIPYYQNGSEYSLILSLKEDPEEKFAIVMENGKLQDAGPEDLAY